MNRAPMLQILSKRPTIAVILLVAGLVVGIQIHALHNYNNYLIFRYSYQHLVQWVNLYGYHDNEHFDRFLYSPAFSLFMAPFAALPDWLGLIIWSLISCFVFFLAIRLLPGLTDVKKSVLFFIVFIEFITSIQNMQTNAMIAAFMVLAFICFEKEKIFWAAFFIVLAASIKIFGLVAAVLFFIYPRKGRFIMYMVFWTALFALIPLAVIPGRQLLWQYRNWIGQLTEIHKSEDFGVPHNYHPPLSVMGWLKTWWLVTIPGLYVQLAGVVLLLAPLVKTRFYQFARFRQFIIASMLIFCVIFNHISESATCVIAVFGAAIWFVNEKKNIIVWLLLAYLILFTVLSATDIFPRQFRTDYVIPYVLKVVPCIFIWFYLEARLLFGRRSSMAGPALE